MRYVKPSRTLPDPWGALLSGARDMEASIPARRLKLPICSPATGPASVCCVRAVLAFVLLTHITLQDKCAGLVLCRDLGTLLPCRWAGIREHREHVYASGVLSTHASLYIRQLVHVSVLSMERSRGTAGLDARIRRALHALVSLSLLDSGVPHAGISPAARLRLMPLLQTSATSPQAARSRRSHCLPSDVLP
jgi:hypothetical protein